MTREEALKAASLGALEMARHSLFGEFCRREPLGRRLVHAIEHSGPEAQADVVREILAATATGRAPGGEWFHNNPAGQQITAALQVLEGITSRRELYRRLAEEG